MNKNYHLDLGKISLATLKRSLQNREMIPSRVILKEDLEERFRLLELHGLNTMKSLMDALKTRDKIEAFSEQSGVPVDYLTILKRDAGSWLPNPVPLKKFTGIEPGTLSALEKIGIKNTKQFFNKRIATNTEQRSDLSGISSDQLSKLLSLADLVRLYGVGPVFAEIIYNAGITSVEQFANHTADTFISIYEEATQKKADFSKSDIGLSLEFANELLLHD